MAFLPQSPDDVRSYGTPGFDTLASTGMYFENAYSTSPICSPSRAGLITGRYQQRWGNYWYNEGGLPAEELTIPEVLSAHGYVTAKIGKTHLNGGPKEFPTEHGFDSYLGFVHHTWDYIRLSQKDVDAYRSRDAFQGFGAQIIGPLVSAKGQGTRRFQAEKVSYENGFTTEIFTDEAVQFIESDKGEKPFYLHIAYNAVHHPTYVVSEKWAKVTGARYVPWDRHAEQWEYPYWEPEKETNRAFHKKWGHMGEIDVDGRRCYLANLLALDDGIQRILRSLEESGQRDNTAIFFVSDNGGTINTYANNTPLSGYKYMFGEGGIRIPMIVSYPEAVSSGVNESSIVSTMDLFPTIMDWAGIAIPENLDGKSLLKVLDAGEGEHHEYIAWAQNRDKWVIRRGKWKLTHNAKWYHRDFKILDNGDVVDNGSITYPDGVQLLDLVNDIGESTNVAQLYPEVVEDLLKLQERWASEMSDPVKMKR